MSHPTTRRPNNAASIIVVPRPRNGSYTVSFSVVSRCTKKRGNCGLKHARYEISCRLLAARCFDVQNSLMHTGTASLPSPSDVTWVLAGNELAICQRPSHTTWLRAHDLPHLENAGAVFATMK